MQAFPVQYSIAAVASSDGDVVLEGVGLPTLASAVPADFGELATGGLPRRCSSRLSPIASC